ncbi:MAG: PepSY domain-containing protein [Proteobacteria bacterium]|nr:MAG: PepSY domain-containing protein [Pseudomonadota bacterium]
MNTRVLIYSSALLLAVTAAGLASIPNTASAQAGRAGTSGSLLSIGEVERRATAAGLAVTEIELEDRLAEVEGRDSQQRKVKLVIDRHTGEILQRKTKEPKLFR